MWNRKFLCVLFVVMVTLSGFVSAEPKNDPPSPSHPSPSLPAAFYVVSPLEQKAVDLLNLDREKEGLPPLKINQKLAKLAGDYALDMSTRKFFSHYNPEGQSPFDRMIAAGIDFPNAGENIALSPTLEIAEKMLFESPTHRENILNTHFTEVGIGVRPDSRGGVYVVQEFIGP